jgi:hypothetical protein
MMKASLKDQVGKNVLSNVDYIVVASRKKTTYTSDLAETFANMRKTQLKLNPEKSVFGVIRGKVLGSLVSIKGIKANLDKISAIIQTQPPWNRKEIQKLTGQIAALNRFRTKVPERSLPFFSVFRGASRMEWGVEQQKP